MNGAAGTKSRTKTHKTSEIARKQLDAGAVGIVSQKEDEAEATVDAVIPDILIPYNIVGKVKVDRLTSLYKRARMTATLDSKTTIRKLSEDLSRNDSSARALVECNTGGGRCGIQTREAAQNLAMLIGALPGSELEGVMTYPSHERATAFWDETKRLFQQSGLSLNTISGDGKGSEAVSKAIEVTR
ncbi:MAG: alanine racemase [Candidatus Latescibacterota bacterium]|nr:alanine racemase [Candidatus Latescibacterota bacterium]